jgi:hypothetical protein
VVYQIWIKYKGLFGCRNLSRKWVGLKIPNLRGKVNNFHFQFRCLDVHGNSCWNQRIAPNSTCLDVQSMELNFYLGLGWASKKFYLNLSNFYICSIFKFLEFLEVFCWFFQFWFLSIFFTFFDFFFALLHFLIFLKILKILFFEFLKNLKIGDNFLWVVWAFGHVELSSINETSKRYTWRDSSQFRAGQLGNMRGRNNTWWIWLGILASFQTRILWLPKQRNSDL